MGFNDEGPPLRGSEWVLNDKRPLNVRERMWAK